MAPVLGQGPVKRQNCYYDTFNNYYCGNSTWDNWGRWVALAVIVVVFVLFAFLFSCYNTRRRRRMGMAPMYGTGWFAGNKPYGNQPNGYYPNQPYNHAAPPYSPPVENQYTGTTFDNNDGYYGNHGPEPGIELQQPQSSYHPQRGGDPVYEAPLGPPPRKGDGIIR